MADKDSVGQKNIDDDKNDDRRQFMARFGKLAVVAAPTVALLVTSVNAETKCSGRDREGEDCGHGH
jgi:hypothetical protein